MIILGYDLVVNFLNDTLKMSSHIATEFFWLTFFIYYVFNYVLDKVIKKKENQL